MKSLPASGQAVVFSRETVNKQRHVEIQEHTDWWPSFSLQPECQHPSEFTPMWRNDTWQHRRGSWSSDQQPFFFFITSGLSHGRLGTAETLVDSRFYASHSKEPTKNGSSSTFNDSQPQK